LFLNSRQQLHEILPFYTSVVADILLYLKNLDSAQTVEFSRRTSSQSATSHKNMFSAHRNMFSVLCEIGSRRYGVYIDLQPPPYSQLKIFQNKKTEELLRNTSKLNTRAGNGA
jgi:hypothetical protein